MKITGRAWVGLLVSMLLAASISADDDTDITYDIFYRDSIVTVWVDMTRCIDAAAIDDLKDGFDLVMQCRTTLARPRRFFGDKRICRGQSTCRLSYRSVSEDYILTLLTEPSTPDRQFISPAALHQFLHDSIEVTLLPLDSLDFRHRYTLEIDIRCISLTDFNLAPNDLAENDNNSPLKYLFKQFLDLTGYGRKEYSAKSRPFSLSELKSEP